MTRDHYKILKDIYTSAGMDVPVITEECAKKFGLEITDRGIALLQDNNDDNIIENNPTIVEECYSIRKKKSRNSKLKKKLKRLENRFDSFDDDIYEIMRR